MMSERDVETLARAGMTAKCGYCIGPEGARLPHCQGQRCTACGCGGGESSAESQTA